MAKLGGNDLVVGHRSAENSYILSKLVHAVHGVLRDDGIVIWEITLHHLCDELRFRWGEKPPPYLCRQGKILS
jgi:hypothetical protein